MQWMWEMVAWKVQGGGSDGGRSGGHAAMALKLMIFEVCERLE